MPVAEVAMIPAALADDAGIVDTLCQVINQAYNVAEAGLWRDSYARTSASELSTAIRGEQVAAARVDDRLVGSICTRELDSRTGWFGVLAVDPRCGGQGVGRELVAFAEGRAVSAGLTHMQLELLTPTEADIAHLQMLAQWYQRLGYRQVARRPLADYEPQALPFLATPCEIVVHLKRLGPEAP